MKRAFLLAIATFLLAACATTSHVDMSEPRRLVATESDVRLDVEVRAETLASSIQIPLAWEVTNNRSTPIAIAELIPETSYDEDTQTVVIGLGAEVPGQEMLPRLAVIAPGQKKSFTDVATVNIPSLAAAYNPFKMYPHAVRVRLDFLNDPQPFAKLIGIPERVVQDPALAGELFPKWIERNETMVTNSLPMKWQGEPGTDPPLPTGSSKKKRAT